jgi:hypothetical protein
MVVTVPAILSLQSTDVVWLFLPMPLVAVSHSFRSLLAGVLSPAERVSEILFGLIMTLSITGTMSVAAGGEEDVSVMLWGVLGCNVAWGIIDGILYLIGSDYEHRRGVVLLDLIRRTGAEKEACGAIAESMPPIVAGVLQPDELEAVRRRLAALPQSPPPPVIRREDLRGALGVCILVVLSCIPVIVPFLLLMDPLQALRTSNAVAIAMLFLCGYALGGHAGTPKAWTGLVMVVLGVLLVGLTIALGG